MYSEKDLIEQLELMALLGYEDERSFKRWCNLNKIPVIKIGLKKYILSQYLTQYIDNQLVIFVKAPDADPNLANYTSKNELVNSYIKKYESKRKSHPTKKR